MVNLMKHKKGKRCFSTISTFLVLLLAIALHSCKSSVEKEILINGKSKVALQIADTIIYDVLIKNPDPENEWINECLENLNKEDLVDFVFDAVYSGKAEAYHYYTNEKYSIAAIEEIEQAPDFSRDKIAKIQFVEEWLLNEEDFSMYKQIHSILLGYEVRDETGSIKGYKPTFRVYLNH